MENIYEFTTMGSVMMLKPSQYGVHYLSCLINEKAGEDSKLGKLGSHAIQFFQFPAVVLDKVIQIIATPIFCIIGNTYEVIKNRDASSAITLIFKLPFHLLGNVILLILYNTITILTPLLTPIMSIIKGAEAGSLFFSYRNNNLMLVKWGLKNQRKILVFNILPTQERFNLKTFKELSYFAAYCI